MTDSPNRFEFMKNKPENYYQSPDINDFFLFILQLLYLYEKKLGIKTLIFYDYEPEINDELA